MSSQEGDCGGEARKVCSDRKSPTTDIGEIVKKNPQFYQHSNLGSGTAKRSRSAKDTKFPKHIRFGDDEDEGFDVRIQQRRNGMAYNTFSSKFTRKCLNRVANSMRGRPRVIRLLPEVRFFLNIIEK